MLLSIIITIFKKFVLLSFKCHLFLWWRSRTASSHYSSLQCHTILQKSFQYADLVLKKHLFLLAMMKTGVQFNIFEEIMILFNDSFSNIELKNEQH